MSESRPPLSPETERIVRHRAEERCSACGCKDSLENAHVIDWVIGKDDRPDNLVLLCGNCHFEIDHHAGADKHALLKLFLLNPWCRRKRGLPWLYPEGWDPKAFEEDQVRQLAIVWAGFGCAVKVCREDPELDVVQIDRRSTFIPENVIALCGQHRRMYHEAKPRKLDVLRAWQKQPYCYRHVDSLPPFVPSTGTAALDQRHLLVYAPFPQLLDEAWKQSLNDLRTFVASETGIPWYSMRSEHITTEAELFEVVKQVGYDQSHLLIAWPSGVPATWRPPCFPIEATPCQSAVVSATFESSQSEVRYSDHWKYVIKHALDVRGAVNGRVFSLSRLVDQSACLREMLDASRGCRFAEGDSRFLALKKFNDRVGVCGDSESSALLQHIVSEVCRRLRPSVDVVKKEICKWDDLSGVSDDLRHHLSADNVYVVGVEDGSSNYDARNSWIGKAAATLFLGVDVASSSVRCLCVAQHRIELPKYPQQLPRFIPVTYRDEVDLALQLYDRLERILPVSPTSRPSDALPSCWSMTAPTFSKCISRSSNPRASRSRRSCNPRRQSNYFGRSTSILSSLMTACRR